jgi:hypothetical protein
MTEIQQASTFNVIKWPDLSRYQLLEFYSQIEAKKVNLTVCFIFWIKNVFNLKYSSHF